tara:strand:- start:32 stop:229 length:198 start_codon:yes stop_codon:yes gene_type:complete
MGNRGGLRVVEPVVQIKPQHPQSEELVVVDTVVPTLVQQMLYRDRVTLAVVVVVLVVLVVKVAPV